MTLMKKVGRFNQHIQQIPKLLFIKRLIQIMAIQYLLLQSERKVFKFYFQYPRTSAHTFLDVCGLQGKQHEALGVVYWLLKFINWGLPVVIGGLISDRGRNLIKRVFFLILYDLSVWKYAMPGRYLFNRFLRCLFSRFIIGSHS